MFRPITLNDKTWMDRCRSSSLNDMTVLSFPAVYTWQSTFGLTVDGEDNFYVIRSEADRGYYYPVGEREACRAYVRSLMEDPRTDPCSGTASAAGSASPVLSSDTASAGSASPALSSAPGSLKLLYVPEQELEWLEEQGFEISCEQNTSEYVYSSRSLALLDHGSGTNYRVKVKHFSRDYVWNSRPLVFPGDEALLREKTAAWDRMCGAGADTPAMGEKTADTPAAVGNTVNAPVAGGNTADTPAMGGRTADTPASDKQAADWRAPFRFPADSNEPLLPHSVHTSDRLALLSSCEDPAAIGLSGIYLETEKGEWAFLLGYPSTDKIYDMSIVKYSPDLSRNAVPVCICEMAKLVADSYPWINLEDDLGEKGLRRMKTLYHPLFLLGSYTAYREIPPVFP